MRLALALFASLFLWACDGDSSGAAQPAPDTLAAADTGQLVDTGGVGVDTAKAPDPGVTADAGAPPSDAGPQVDVPTGPAYPAGPYGTRVGDTIAPDVGFFDPWTKEWITMADYWDHFYMKVIIVSSAAGWCGPCQLEAVEFLDLYDEHGPWGLEILYALFEDTLAKTLCTADTNDDCSYEAQTMQFMNAWKNGVDAEGGRVIDYPLLVDPQGADGWTAMDPFYEENAVPLAIMVTLKDMKVVYKSHGYSAAFVGYEVLKHLYNE